MVISIDVFSDFVLELVTVILGVVVVDVVVANEVRVVMMDRVVVVVLVDSIVDVGMVVVESVVEVVVDTGVEVVVIEAINVDGFVVVLHVLTLGSSVKTEVFVTDMPDISRYTSPYSAFVNPLMPSTANDLIEVW